MESIKISLDHDVCLLIGKLVAEKIADNNVCLMQAIDTVYIRPLQESKILKKVDVAGMLKVSPSTVTALVESGALSTTLDGRITEYHLRQYLTCNGKNHPNDKTK